MDKKAQGLPITTIILAILGLVILVILFAITTGRMAIFGRGVSECPGRCVDEFSKNQAHAPTNEKCIEGIEKELVGKYVLAGQPSGTAADALKQCSRCCVPLA